MAANNSTAQSGLFEASLFRLHSLLRAMRPFMESLEKEETDDDQIDRGLTAILKAVNPKVTDDKAQEAASWPILTVAFNEVLNLSYELLSAWKLVSAPKADNPSVETLLEWTCNASTGQPPTREKIYKNLPWMLHGALDYILSTGRYKKHPAAGDSVAVRILSCILLAFQNVPGTVKQPGGKYLTVVR